VKRAYIYATKPTSLVIGRVDVDGYETASRNAIWRKYNGRGGITKAQFFRYFADVEYAVAVRVSKPRRMSRYVELAQLREAKAVPQSFRYLGDADVGILERAMR
jgi:predicted transcriptional regulator